MLARVGSRRIGSAYQSSQSGELLYSLLNPASRASLAAGGRMLHEPDGVNVWLGRIVAGRDADSWLVHGNLLFQKPMAEDRDSVDLITSVGWAHKLPHGMSLGVEAIGEDLEGFWEAEEVKAGRGCWSVRAFTFRRTAADGSSSQPAARCSIRQTPADRAMRSETSHRKQSTRATRSRRHCRLRSFPHAERRRGSGSGPGVDGTQR